jgi:hypothetical protein
MSLFRITLPILAISLAPLAAWAQNEATTGAGTSAAAGGTAVTVNPDGTRLAQPAPATVYDSNGAVISTGAATGDTSAGTSAAVTGATDAAGNAAGGAQSMSGSPQPPNTTPAPAPSATPASSATPVPLNSDTNSTTTNNGVAIDPSTGNGAPATDANTSGAGNSGGQ